MKKLTYLVSAIAAAFTANSYADVSVSGSLGAGYVNDVNGDGNVVNSGTVSFGLSTTTANGMTVSGSLGLSVSPTSENGATGTGGQQITFATGGSTITVGDIAIADQPGSVGGVAGAATVEHGNFDMDVASGFADDDGNGVSLSTSVAGSTVSLGYIFDTDGNSVSDITNSTKAATAFGVSVPMGAYTVSAGFASHDDGHEASGASVSAAMGAGTLTVGYSSQTMTADTSAVTGAGAYSFNTTSGLAVRATPAVSSASADDADAAGDTTVMGATYVLALDADTSVSLGYQNKKDADDDQQTQFDLAISRSLGGGASVYMDMRSLSGDAEAAGGDGTSFGFGTSVSF